MFLILAATCQKAKKALDPACSESGKYLPEQDVQCLTIILAYVTRRLLGDVVPAIFRCVIVYLIMALLTLLTAAFRDSQCSPYTGTSEVPPVHDIDHA